MAQLRDLLVNGASRFLGVVNFNDEVNMSKTLTLLNTTDASLNVNAAKPALLIGAYDKEHLEIDTHEIMAKNANGTASTLSLNADGGSTFVGGELIIKGDLIPSNDSQATKLIGASDNKWTHIYATNVTATTFTGSLAGNATSADKLTVNAGGDTTPIYFKDGKPTACAGPLSVGVTGNAASATKVFVLDNDASGNAPTAATKYYLSYSTGKGSNQSLRANADLYYYESGTGESWLNVGNSSSPQHKGNLTLHSGNSYYTNIVSSAASSNKTFTLPNTTGTAVVLETKTSSGQTTPGTITELNIYGECYGNTKANLLAEGKLSYGDPGPQIRFSSAKDQGSSTQSMALIYTNNDGIHTGNSLSLVSTESEAAFIAPRIRALSGFTGNGAAITNINANNIATGTLPITRGGTGNTAFTSGALVYASSTSKLASATAMIVNGSVLTITKSGADAAKVRVTNDNGSVELLSHTNKGIYDPDNSAWIIYRPKGTTSTYVPAWASVGTTSRPVYFNGNGVPAPITGAISGTYGGTGSSEHEANRLVWSASTTKIQGVGSHYADGTHIGVNYTSQPTTTFRVGGTSYLGGDTNIEGELSLVSSVKFVYNNTDKCVDVIFN